MSNESISAILERTLDLIENDDKTESQIALPAPSAASLLLAEKRRLKDQALANKEQDFISLTSSSELTKPVNYFLDQIAGSTVDPPTHWKGLNAQKSKTKDSALPVITNIQKASKLRGEAYQDKRLSKHASTASRKERMHRLKNMY